MDDTNPDEKNTAQESGEKHPLPSADEVSRAMAEFEAAHSKVQPPSVQPPIPAQQPSAQAAQPTAPSTPPVPAPAAPTPVQKIEPEQVPPAEAVPAAPVQPASFKPAPISAPATVPTRPLNTDPQAPVFVAPVMPPAPIEKAAPGSLQDQALSAKLPEKKMPAPVPQQPPAPVVPPASLSAKPIIATAPTQPAPPTPGTPVKSESDTILHPLRTLRSDTEESVKERKTSLISIAAAEENRRAHGESQLLDETVAAAPKRSYTWLIVSVIVLLFIGGAGALVYVFFPREVPVKEQQPLSNALISVDDAVAFPLQGEVHTSLLQKLSLLRDKTQLSLGLIREIYPEGVDANGQKYRIGIQEFFPVIAPSASPELIRSLSPDFVLGVHVFDGNQMFLILTTSQYEQAYAEMVRWEPTMLADLSPLFDRKPRPRAPNEQLSTTTLPAVIKSDFIDMVVENQDARVLRDAQGNGILLWTFVNEHTFVIATNDRTLREVVSRIRHTPVKDIVQ